MSHSKHKKEKICCQFNRYLIIVLAFLVGLPLYLSHDLSSQIVVNEKEILTQMSMPATINVKEEMKGILFHHKIDHENIRGIYITAETAASNHFSALMDQLIRSGGNAIVMDIELSGGQLAFTPKNQSLLAINPGSDKLNHLSSLIRALHEKDIYVIARQVIFNDPFTAARKPEWRIKEKNGAWFDSRWLDPSHPEVQHYNLLITEELAQFGFDEVQYDYIRFPAENHNTLDYHYDETSQQRWEVIRDFLNKAKAVTSKHHIKLGIDVFGATIWGNIDWDNVGQYIPELAKTVDVIYPMTYPSHVSPGYYGFNDPYHQPYSFIKGSIEKFVETSNGQAEIRTWIQGFPLRIPNFGPWFVQEQIRGTYDAGANDFVIWSPGNKYEASWSSMKIEAPAENIKKNLLKEG